MSFLDQISQVIAPGISNVEAQAQAASDQLTLAFETLIGLNALIAIELFFVIVLLYKRRG